MQRWLVNGDSQDSIGLSDRGLNYADGLFETIAVRSGQPRFFEKHLDRLATGCRRLGIPAQDGRVLAGEAAQLIDDSMHGTIKIIVTRGSAERGYALPETPVPTRIVGFSPVGSAGPQSPHYGARLRICDTPISGTPALAGLKTLARLEQVVARAEWQDPGIVEGLMRDTAGRIICGTMSNLFIVCQGKVLTPDLSQCGANGVMRSVVMDQAKQCGIMSREQAIVPGDLAHADEVFVTNALIGIWPVIRVDAWHYRLGPVTRQLMMRLSQAGVGECSI